MNKIKRIGLLIVLYGIFIEGCGPHGHIPIRKDVPAALINLEIHIIDVGQGDCFLIVTPAGKKIMIDAGTNGWGTERVLPYLKNLGITSLDYIVASHYHSDHIGGLDEVVNGLGGSNHILKAAYDRGEGYRSTSFSDYISSVGDKRMMIYPGQTIDLGDMAKLACISSSGNIRTGRIYTGIDENALSIVLILKYRNFDMYFGGDSNYIIEPFIAPYAGDVDVYKVSHHGSNTSSSRELLTYLNPEVSIISLGNGYPYTFPHRDTLTRLRDTNSYIYQTEAGSNQPPEGYGEVANGDFKIVSDGYHYTISGSSLISVTRLADTGVPHTENQNVIEKE